MYPQVLFFFMGGGLPSGAVRGPFYVEAVAVFAGGAEAAEVYSAGPEQSAVVEVG